MMTQGIEVFKFGGTSVGSAERMQEITGLVASGRERRPIVVVASAMSGVTNQLVAGAQSAADGDRRQIKALGAALLTRHLGALSQLASPAPAEVEVELHALIEELTEILGAVTRLGELTPRIRDRVLATGEKLSVRLLALALREAGIPAQACDADRFLETNANFGEADPLTGLADRKIRSALLPLIEQGVVPVVTGFCGRAPDGATTTLGRGGSDYSATLVAAALDAEEVTIWTDVSGVFTAHPGVVSGARVVQQLNYREAAELSYYGAKVLHQRTMIPVAERNIPVWIRNTMAPEDAGTVVNGQFTPGSHPVKAISAVGGQALVSIEGKGMAGVPGVAGRVFAALAEAKINVTMISQ